MKTEINLRSKKVILILTAMAGLFLFQACEKDPSNPDDKNPQEVITTVRIRLINSSDTNDVITASWRDLDGPGGVAPVIDTLNIREGKTYLGMLTVLDESKNPVVDITEEIKKEANVHQFFYSFSQAFSGRLTLERTDKDQNNPPLPLGLNFTVSSGAGGAVPVSGNLNVVLSHYDKIPKNTAPSPETDLDVLFPVVLF